jgi:prolyl-tRNA synthetase
MGATFTNEQGQEMPLVMGCYGLGVSRLAQAAIEQSHDEYGIIWSPPIAPYLVIISIPNMQESQQVEVAEKLYQELQNAGIEVLLDDRPERAGVKFKDADLLGIPYRMVPGRSLAQNKVEIITRKGRISQEILVSNVVEFFRSLTP